MSNLKPSAIHIREKQLCNGMITFPLQHITYNHANKSDTS